MEFLESIKSFITGTDFLNLGQEWTPAGYIILLGVILLLVAFGAALIIRSASKGNKFRKHLDETTAAINAGDTIDENNVETLNARIQDPRMATSVAKGWGAFLEQQTGYPSDYISSAEVFGDRKTNPDYKGGKGFFACVGAIIVVICMALAAIGCMDVVKDAALNTGAGVAAVMEFILPVLGTIVIPLLIYIILLGVLGILSSGLYKKTKQSFDKFTEALDEKVIIFRETQDDFITENIEEINAAIEDILAHKLGDSEILEIVTTPKVDEELVIEDIPVSEPVPAPAPAPAPVEEAAADEAPAEPSKEQVLIQLVYIADAMSKDPGVTEQDLIELATYLDQTKESGVYNDEEKEIFDACLIILTGTYDERFGNQEQQ